MQQLRVRLAIHVGTGRHVLVPLPHQCLVILMSGKLRAGSSIKCVRCLDYDYLTTCDNTRTSIYVHFQCHVGA